MYFANPWGLLGLISLPVIAAIHLYQRRFPPLLVAGAHLWGAESQVQTAGRRRDRLPITPSLLLELLAGLIFSLALAQPRYGELGEVLHLVVVLDDSASMSARPPEEASFREAAIEKLRERVDAMERGARITLIRSGRQPTLLAGRAILWEEANSALANWRPRAAQHDFHPAWDEAARMAGPDGRFLFLTDYIPDEKTILPRGMEIIAVGRPLPNLAIAAARWTYDSQAGTGQLFLRITNVSTTPARATLTVDNDGRTLFQRAIDVPAGGSVPMEAELPGGLGQLTITLDAPGDGLAVDNTVTLVEPKIRLLTVAVAYPADSVEGRLIGRVLDAARDVQTGPVSDAHLIIGPVSEPPALPREQWWFGIGPLNESPVVRRQARDLLGPYLIEKQHPLMDGIVLGGVVWGGVQPTDLDLRPLISAGRTCLLGQIIGQPSTAYVMNIDLARSNISESPDWPILMANLLELRRDELPGLRVWNYRVNESVRFHAPPDAETERSTLTLVLPSGTERALIRDRNDVVEISRLDETGVYEIRDGERSVGRFAVNFFDDQESSLSALESGRREARADVEASQLWRDDLYSWLMALAILMLLAAILGDWYLLNRRR